MKATYKYRRIITGPACCLAHQLFPTRRTNMSRNLSRPQQVKRRAVAPGIPLIFHKALERFPVTGHNRQIYLELARLGRIAGLTQGPKGLRGFIQLPAFE